MISFRHKGDFELTTKFLKKDRKKIESINFEKYGQIGVNALSSATPVDSGTTAKSWAYEVVRGKDFVSIRYYNTNVESGIPIAVLIQYGHATKNGGWIEGRDYINPSIQPIFDKIVKDVWGEVTK